MKKILFVCQGNAIRSIMAEAIFNNFKKKGYKSISAGTIHISSIEPNTKLVLKEIKIPLTKKKPTPLIFEDIINAEKIIILNKDIPNIPSLIPKKQMIYWAISDPIGKPIEDFRKTREKIIKKVTTLIKKLN